MITIISTQHLIGRRVLCVDVETSSCVRSGYQHWVGLNEIYTIRDVKRTLVGLGLLFQEIENPKVYIQDSDEICEPSFNYRRVVLIPEDPIEANKFLLNTRPNLN